MQNCNLQFSTSAICCASLADDGKYIKTKQDKKECVVGRGMWYALQCAMPPQGGANTFFDIFLTGEHSKKMVGMKPSRIFRCFSKWHFFVLA